MLPPAAEMLWEQATAPGRRNRGTGRRPAVSRRTTWRMPSCKCMKVLDVMHPDR